MMSTTYKNVKLFIENKVDEGLEKVGKYQSKAEELIGLSTSKVIKEDCKDLTTQIDDTKQKINKTQEQTFSKFSELEGIAGETQELEAELENQQTENKNKIKELEAVIEEAKKLGYPNLADLEQELERLNSLAETTQTKISDTLKIKKEIDEFPGTLFQDTAAAEDESGNNSEDPRDYLKAGLKKCQKLCETLSSTFTRVSNFLSKITLSWGQTKCESKKIIAESKNSCASAATKIQDFFTWKQTRQPTP